MLASPNVIPEVCLQRFSIARAEFYLKLGFQNQKILQRRFKSPALKLRNDGSLQAVILFHGLIKTANESYGSIIPSIYVNLCPDLHMN